MNGRMLSVGAAVALAITASSPVRAEDPWAEWGKKPDQAEAEKMATEALGQLLKDPYSAHIRWEPIDSTDRWEDNGPPCFGWMLYGHVNAKNSYGGYVGEKRYAFYLRDGRLDCVVTETRIGRQGNTMEARVL